MEYISQEISAHHSLKETKARIKAEVMVGCCSLACSDLVTYFSYIAQASCSSVAPAHSGLSSSVNWNLRKHLPDMTILQYVRGNSSGHSSTVESPSPRCIKLTPKINHDIQIKESLGDLCLEVPLIFVILTLAVTLTELRRSWIIIKVYL